MSEFDGFPEETAERQPEVTRELEILSYQTEALAKNMDALSKRLEPVISHRPSVGGSNMDKEAEATSALANSVRRNREAVERANATLSYLFQSLEI